MKTARLLEWEFARLCRDAADIVIVVKKKHRQQAER